MASKKLANNYVRYSVEREREKSLFSLRIPIVRKRSVTKHEVPTLDFPFFLEKTLLLHPCSCYRYKNSLYVIVSREKPVQINKITFIIGASQAAFVCLGRLAAVESDL
jgi:hypothetical protein